MNTNNVNFVNYFNLVKQDSSYNVSLVTAHLENHKSYLFISDLLNISFEDIKEIVYMYLPHLTNEDIIKINHKEIEELVRNKVSICIIACKYGIQESKLCRYLITHFPEHNFEMMESIQMDHCTGDVFMYSGSTWYKVNV